MIRQIITIEKEKCNGCGLCVDSCHEGAIQMINGKAELTRDDYCDGLGNCLPACPTGAITFETREALPFDKAAVEKNNFQTIAQTTCSCPGSAPHVIDKASTGNANFQKINSSELSQWPIQIKLVAVNATYFTNAHLLIAADCTAFTYGNFHQDFIKNRITLIGCPKLDEGDYTEKIEAILRNNTIKSVTIVKMEVPCCRGIENSIVQALQNCGKMIPWQVHTVSIQGELIE